MSGYVYIKTEPALWTVGFHDPEGMWHTESDHGSPEDAATRVALLNGHAQPVQIDLAATETTQVEVQPEAGTVDRYKLYVHQGGRTIVRVYKLRDNQIRLDLATGFRRARS